MIILVIMIRITITIILIIMIIMPIIVVMEIILRIIITINKITDSDRNDENLDSRTPSKSKSSIPTTRKPASGPGPHPSRLHRLNNSREI